MKFSVNSKMKELFEDQRAWAVVEKYIPRLTRTPTFRMTFGMSFRTLCQFSQWKLTAEQLAAADEELKKL